MVVNCFTTLKKADSFPIRVENEDSAFTMKPTETKSTGKHNDLYTTLVTVAPYLPGAIASLDPLEEIPWIDKTLIDHCISFHKKFLTRVILANTAALMFGFAVKTNSAVIVKTGKLHNPDLSYERYLSTMQRIGKFLMFPFEPAKAYVAFSTVRKMHSLAVKKGRSEFPQCDTPTSINCQAEEWKRELAAAIRSDLEFIDTSEAPKEIMTWNPPVPVSQFDMALTQFGFIGTMWIFPKMFGIRDRHEEMKGVIHVWAIIGRLLGIHDDYNVCLKPDEDLYEKLFRNLVLESLKTMDETVVTIQSAFMEGLNKRLPFMTYKGLMFSGLCEIEGFKGDHLWKLMSLKDIFSYKILVLWIWLMRNSSIFNFFMNITTGLWLQLQFWLHLSTSLWD